MTPHKAVRRVWQATQALASAWRRGSATSASQELTPAVEDHVSLPEPPPEMPCSHMISPRLEVILNISGFPETTQDTEDIMRMLRSRRDHNATRKIAAEQAIDWCTAELQILERSSVCEEDVRRTLTHLRALQCELAAAMDDLAKSRHDIGVIRGLIQSKGLPIPHLVPPEAARKAINSDSQTSSDSECSSEFEDSSSEEHGHEHEPEQEQEL